ARGGGNQRERATCRSVTAPGLLLGHLTQDRDLGEGGAHVIVQIGGDSAANAFEFGQPLFLAAPQRLLRTLTLSDIANDAGEIATAVSNGFAERNLQWDFVAIAMQAGQLNGLPCQAPLSRAPVTGKALLVSSAQTLRHQTHKLAPDQFSSCISKDAPGSRV